MRNNRVNILSVTIVVGIILMAVGCTRNITTQEGGFFIPAEPATSESNTTESTKVPNYYEDDCVVEYTRLEDGTYDYKGIKYTYKHIISGIMPGNTHRSTMVVLGKGTYYDFESFSRQIIEQNKINYYTYNDEYKIVELHHHENCLQNGRYISEKEGDSIYIELSEGYVSFWDFSNVPDEDDIEYYLSSVEPKLSYRVDCRYMIVDDHIELYTNPSRPDITIIDDVTLEYNGVKYVYEENSTKEEFQVVNKTGYPQYDELIELIVNIKDTSEYPRKVYEENGICDIFGVYDTFESSGFYLVDLDGDGVEELLLGENGFKGPSGIIFMIYTIRDGELVKVCSGGERDTYMLCEGNYIMEDLSGGAAYGATAYYTFEDSKLKLKEAVVYDGYYDPDNPLFLCTERLDVATGVHITNEEAAAIHDKYQERLIEFTLFARPEYK